jgi:Tfp pilus assembly protein PilO
MKSKLILVAALAAVAITALWFFVLWSPQSDSLTKARADEQAARQRQTELQNRLAHLKQLEANADVLERDRAMLATAIPDTDQLDQFIHQVNERAAAAGVSFVSVTPTEPAAAGVPGAAATTAAPGTPPAVGLQLQVSGDYFAIMHFMDALQAPGSRLVTVENLALAKGGATAGLTASIGGKMFVSPPSPTPTATPTPTASA